MQELQDHYTITSQYGDIGSNLNHEQNSCDNSSNNNSNIQYQMGEQVDYTQPSHEHVQQHRRDLTQTSPRNSSPQPHYSEDASPLECGHGSTPQPQSWTCNCGARNNPQSPNCYMCGAACPLYYNPPPDYNPTREKMDWI